MPSEPDVEKPLTNEETRESSGSEDIFLTVQQQPRPLGRMESFQKEKHISVDPISIKGAMVRQASFTLVSPQHTAALKPPSKLKFISTSLPSSTSSSPRSGSGSLLKKIWKNENDNSHFSRDEFDLMPEERPITKSDPEEGFKCGKLCLFLPRGKGKPVKPSSSVSPLPQKTKPPAISRTVSLERFDCGSPSKEATNLFFDLPLELMRCSVSDMQSPVTAAFVFDKDDKLEPKGVLKNTQCRTSKSQDPTRHVRFSTSSPTTYPSSPTCITPRLRKARQDFNSFLESQS